MKDEKEILDRNINLLCESLTKSVKQIFMTGEDKEDENDGFCDKYDHLPEKYNLCFWRCSLCKKELFFMEEETYQKNTQTKAEVAYDMIQAIHNRFFTPPITDEELKQFKENYEPRI